MTTDVRTNIDKLLSQWKDTPLFSEYLKGVLNLIQTEIVDPLIEIERLGDIDNAYGIWLDLIGKIYDIRRFKDESGNDISDDTYRNAIKMKALLLYRGRTTQDLNDIFQINFPGASMDDEGNMHVRVQINQHEVVEYNLFKEVGLIPRPLGVEILIGRRSFFNWSAGQRMYYANRQIANIES